MQQHRAQGLASLDGVFGKRERLAQVLVGGRVTQPLFGDAQVAQDPRSLLKRQWLGQSPAQPACGSTRIGVPQRLAGRLHQHLDDPCFADRVDLDQVVGDDRGIDAVLEQQPRGATVQASPIDR